MCTTPREAKIGQESVVKGGKTSWALFFGVAALVLVVDQVTKHVVLTQLSVGEMWNPVPLLMPFIRVTHVTNTGAAFGMFREYGVFFALVAVVVVIGIIGFYRYLPPNQGWLRVSLGLQLGGALGNLLDRIRLGSVVDFIDFRPWPAVFNLADTAIVVGVAILAFYLLFINQEDESAAQQQG
jgi:signal peptidase II